MLNKIAIVIPTRGVVVGDCIQSVINNVKEAGLEYDLHIISGMNIPDCFNEGASRALQSLAKFLWFVEEDVVVPKMGLRDLLNLNSDISIIDYPMKNGFGTVAYYKGRAMWCGTGCTLISTESLLKMPKPYFRTDMIYEIKYDGEFMEKRISNFNTYGGHDIRFGLVANKLGMKISVVPNITCKHRKLISLGQGAVNNGLHTFKDYESIGKSNALKKDPLPSVTVYVDSAEKTYYSNIESL